MLIKKASKYHCLALFLQGLLKKRWAPNKPSLQESEQETNKSVLQTLCYG